MVLTQEEKRQKHLEEGIGVPHVIIDCHEASSRPPVDELLEADKLPSLEDVSIAGSELESEVFIDPKLYMIQCSTDYLQSSFMVHQHHILIFLLYTTSVIW